MQKLQRSLQTFIQNTLELKSESSKDKALHALGKFEKFLILKFDSIPISLNSFEI